LIGLDDCCRAIIAGLDIDGLEGQCWQLDDGHCYEVATLLRETRRQLQLPPPWLCLPRPLVYAAITLARWSAPVTGLGIGQGTYATLYLERFRPDPRYGELTGFAPRQEFYQELRSLVEI
jgi:hypothetical protein